MEQVVGWMHGKELDDLEVRTQNCEMGCQMWTMNNLSKMHQSVTMPTRRTLS